MNECEICETCSVKTITCTSCDKEVCKECIYHYRECEYKLCMDYLSRNQGLCNLCYEIIYERE